MRTVPVTGHGFALAASVLLLAGCGTTEPAPPAPLTDAEARDVAAELSDNYWEYLTGTYPGIERPEAEFVDFVTLATVEAVRANCMRQLALDGDGDYIPGDVQSLEFGLYECSTKYPFDPRESGYLSDAQAEYAYNYLTSQTAPCLQALGYLVPEAPSRQDFVDAHGSNWSPYWGLDRPTVFRDLALIDFKCPPLIDSPYGQIFHPGT